jgi:hypothetical protein
VDFAAALPDDLPVSVEAPNRELIERLGPAAFLRRARAAAHRVLAAAARVAGSAPA